MTATARSNARFIDNIDKTVANRYGDSLTLLAPDVVTAIWKGAALDLLAAQDEDISDARIRELLMAAQTNR